MATLKNLIRRFSDMNKRNSFQKTIDRGSLMPSPYDTSNGTIFRLFRSDSDQEEIVAFDPQGIKTGNFPVFPAFCSVSVDIIYYKSAFIERQYGRLLVTTVAGRMPVCMIWGRGCRRCARQRAGPDILPVCQSGSNCQTARFLLLRWWRCILLLANQNGKMSHSKPWKRCCGKALAKGSKSWAEPQPKSAMRELGGSCLMIWAARYKVSALLWPKELINGGNLPLLRMRLHNK